MINVFDSNMKYLYGKLNNEIKVMPYQYSGVSTDTITITIDNKALTIQANAVPATTAQLDEYL